ncbi:MAG TPA: helix-turn-helix domain-containing protein [Patescibacteria group bacterium]|nr:helix-turn-helix domain-containing protein [Patescibacteria group bacterium]
MQKVTIKPITIECSSVKQTLDVMGGKWKPLIIFMIKSQSLRTSEIQRGIAGITPKMLIQQLRELEDDKIVARKVFPVIPPHVEYSLTDYGKTLLPIMKLMEEWGTTHRSSKHSIT